MNRAHQVRPGSSRTDYLGFETACAVRPYDRLIELAPKERNEFVFSVSLCLCVSVVKLTRAWLQDHANLERET